MQARKIVGFAKKYERWHAFHRSPEDFHARLQGSVIDNHDKYREYVTNLHSFFNDKLHVVLSDDLYEHTEHVLNGICKTLGLDEFDFSEAARFGVNINGNPGARNALVKSRGDYPAVLDASRSLSEPLTRQLCKELEGILRISLCSRWLSHGA